MSVDCCEPTASVGVEEIDASHRQIGRRMRYLARAVAEGGVEPVRTALRSLQLVLADHYGREEGWMAEQGYPGAGEHVRGHRAIVESIARARLLDGSGAEARLADAAAAIAHAVEEHMRSEDLKLGRFFTARDNRRRLAERGPGVGMSLTPIPGAIGPVTPVPGEGPAPAGRATRPAGAREDQPAAPPSPRTRK